jgi:carbamoyl-phosphate synthase large subunit
VRRSTGYKNYRNRSRCFDLAEDRGRFSELLTELKIPFPQFGIAETADEASALAVLDFPLLIRPSYVLGGQGMKSD